MKKQIFSFGWAFRGFWSSVCEEPHLRFHSVAGLYVLAFSFFYDFYAAQWAALIVLIALVIATELINTAVERVCNAVTREKNPLIQIAKDAAAGAVLISAIAAVAVAVIFFWKPETLWKILMTFTGAPVLFVPLGLSAAVSVIFIWLGPTGIKNKLTKKKR